MVDAIRHMLATIEQSKHDGTEEYADLKDQLVALQKDGEGAQGTSTPPSPEAVGVVIPTTTSEVSSSSTQAVAASSWCNRTITTGSP